MFKNEENKSIKFPLCMAAATLVTVTVGTWNALVDRQEQAAARIQWRRDMDAKYGAGVVGEGRGSEYSLAGSIALNSLLVGVIAFPLGFVIGGGLRLPRKNADE